MKTKGMKPRNSECLIKKDTHYLPTKEKGVLGERDNDDKIYF